MLNATKKILTIQNKTEETFLRKRPADFDFSASTEKDRRALISAMRSIMHRANGVGLSANQVGLDIQCFIAEVPRKNKSPRLYALFNPRIVNISKETTELEEGCLSVPHTHGIVRRPQAVTLTGFDKHQKPVTLKASGLLARIIQHEMDHLNGALFIDKATRIQTEAS